MGEEALGVIEIVPMVRFYDYEAKYAPGGSKHLLPAPLSSFVYQQVRRLALAAHRALGCRGVSRTDFRYDDRLEGIGGLVCLEVNTQPGMTETSLVPELAGTRASRSMSWCDGWSRTPRSTAEWHRAQALARRRGGAARARHDGHG